MKVDYDLYYKGSGSGNKGHYVESNESVSISLSHDYTTKDFASCKILSSMLITPFLSDGSCLIVFY